MNEKEEFNINNVDGRESSLSGDSSVGQRQQVRVLGEPLSDRSSSLSEGDEHRPRTLVDADGRRANVVEYQPEVDSLQFFEEQERQIVQQLARETLVNEHHQQQVDGVEQRPLLDEDDDELMSRIEEAEENDEENGEEVEGQKKEEEEAEENGEEVEGQKEEEEKAEENEEENEEEVEGQKEEEENGEEVEGQKEEEQEEVESASSRHSNNAEQQPLSNYSPVSESVQNREFPGTDFLSHSEEFNGHQKINSAQPSTEGYSIGYPTEPPPAYSSPRNERPGTSTSRMFLGGPARFAVPAPYEMATAAGDVPQEDKADAEEHFAGERTSSASNIHNAIGNSLTFAGGMAAAVLASPSEDDPQLKTSKFSSPRANFGVDSPRGDGHRQNAARVVQGARTVAELQQRGQTARARSAKGRNAELSDQQPKEENGLPQFPISAELKALFGHIEEYVAERVDIGPTWKPFQIDYIPAVGDVDPFIKVPRPDDNDVLLLGLAVLDEPATQQSDSAIVDLRLHQMAGNSSADVPVKKLSRADKNAHQIDRWVQSVKELRRTKAPTRVVYGKPMPSIEALMQEWPPEVEQKLKDIKLLLNANLDADLEDFVDLCLGLADIPVHKSRLESLHVLFSLYAEFRASQHFRNMALDCETDGAERAPSTNIDQFVVPE